MNAHPPHPSRRHTLPAQAFTLVELVLVITIIAVLAGSAIFFLNQGGITDVAKQQAAESSIRDIANMVDLYEGRNYRPPTTEQGLMALVEKTTIEPLPQSFSQLLDEVPVDPWGTPYQYRSPAEKSKDGYDLFSAGADRQPDTEDDIGNWKAKPASE